MTTPNSHTEGQQLAAVRDAGQITEVDSPNYIQDDILHIVGDDGEISFSRPFAPLDPIDDRGNYLLFEEWQVRWTVGARKYRLRLPQGWPTDIASIPRLATGLVGFLPDGLVRNAALPHDALYQWRNPATDRSELPPGWFQRDEWGVWVDCTGAQWTKDQIDRLFLRIMKLMGVGAVKRWLMYKAVAWFGGLAWRQIDVSREQWREAFVGK